MIVCTHEQVPSIVLDLPIYPKLNKSILLGQIEAGALRFPNTFLTPADARRNRTRGRLSISGHGER